MLWVYFLILLLSAWFSGFVVGVLRSDATRKAFAALLFTLPTVAFVGWGAFGQTGIFVASTNSFDVAFWLLLPLLLAWIAIAAAGFLGGAQKRRTSP